MIRKFIFTLEDLSFPSLLSCPRSPARFALTRLPHGLTAVPLAQALFNLVASVTERVYVQVYSRSEQLYTMELPDNALSTLLQNMVKAFVGWYVFAQTVT